MEMVQARESPVVQSDEETFQIKKSELQKILAALEKAENLISR